MIIPAQCMRNMRFIYRKIALAILPSILLFGYKWPELSIDDVRNKVQLCFESHAVHNQFSQELIERILINYINYFPSREIIFSEDLLNLWENPTPIFLQRVSQQIRNNNLQIFHTLVVEASNKIAILKNGNPEEQKQFEELKSICHGLIDGLLQLDLLKQITYTLFLKSFTSSLDAHSEYLTPEELDSFIVEIQQETVGIGVVLDKISEGAHIIEVLDGGPAAISGKIFRDDIITHVEGEYLGQLTLDVIAQRLKNKEDTSVNLQIKRGEETFALSLVRKKIALQRKRLEMMQHAFGDGIIAIIGLHSFYASTEHSCSVDLTKTIRSLKQEFGPRLKSIILDLRRNAGGLLKQGIEVTNLFIKAGVVVSISDNKNATQIFRHFGEQTLWQGPLFILVSRASASCAEIVAQSLQDYGRAIIIGDDRTYGKGSFQTFMSENMEQIESLGEIKLTKGMYHTVSGKTPQAIGVHPDIIVPGLTSEVKIGEEFSSYFLQNKPSNPLFHDLLIEIPEKFRQRILPIYLQNKQPIQKHPKSWLESMQKNSQERILNNSDYQQSLSIPDKEESIRLFLTNSPFWKECDFQLLESLNVVKDYLYLQDTSPHLP